MGEQNEMNEINEMKMLVIKAEVNDKIILLNAVYRPPSTRTNDFVKCISEYFNSLTESYNFNVFTGDINIDILSETEVTNEYLNTLTVNGFVGAINTFTRRQNNSETCIDHIFVKRKHKSETANMKICHLLFASRL